MHKLVPSEKKIVDLFSKQNVVYFGKRMGQAKYFFFYAKFVTIEAVESFLIKTGF